MLDVAIVGGGLFGSVVAANLSKAGAAVALIEDGRPLSGAKAAGCLMKPSWMTMMAKSAVDQGLETLDALYGLRTLEFFMGPLTHKVFWVPPGAILGDTGATVFTGTVEDVATGKAFLAGGEVVEAKHLVVAAGAWTSQLLPEVPVTAKAGLSLRLKQAPEDNRISVWAPYKQLVRFSSEGFHWSGDGSAILEKNWTGAARGRSWARITDFAGAGDVTDGLRPFASIGKDPALLEQVRPGVWALTGGGKNGTIAAGWAAAQLKQTLA